MGSLFSSLTLTEISAARTTGIWERQKREEKSRKEKGAIADVVKRIISCYTAAWRGPGEMGIAD